MVWTYSGNPGESAKDQTRFLLGDTDECDQLLQDGEILWVLSLYNNAPMNAAIRCCEVVAAKFARLADETLGREAQNFSQKARGMRLLRRDLVQRLSSEDCSPFVGGASHTQKETTACNPDRVEPKFTDSMMENRQIGPAVTDSGPGWRWW